MTRQAASVQAERILKPFGLQGEGAYRGDGISLTDMLAERMAQGLPYETFTDSGERIELDGNGSLRVSPANPRLPH